MAINGALGQLGASRTYNGLTADGAPSSGSASAAYAALTRDQWANYVQTFIPVENQLIKYAMDTSLPGAEMAKASQNVQSAFNAQEGATQRTLSGLGVSLSADEQAAQKRSFGLSKSLADVQAQNMVGDVVRSRQQGLLGSPMPSALPKQAGV